MLTFDDLPSISGTTGPKLHPGAGRSSVRQTVLGRRTLLKSGFLGGASILTMRSLGVLGRPISALAQTVPAHGACTASIAYYGTSSTAGPCGPDGYQRGDGCKCDSTDNVSSDYCANQQFLSRHKTCTENNTEKKFLYRVNECWNNFYDGWRWKTAGPDFQACGCYEMEGMLKKVYSCNDGYVSEHNGSWGPYFATICLTSQCSN